MMRNLKYIAALSACLLLSCSKDEQNPVASQPASAASPTTQSTSNTLANWIKGKRIYFSDPHAEWISWFSFSMDGTVSSPENRKGTYTVKDLTVSLNGKDGQPGAKFIFPNAIVSKGDTLQGQPASGDPENIQIKVFLVDEITDARKSFIDYEADTTATLGQGAIAKALENKRLYFGVHGFETNCVQFLSNGMVLAKGNYVPWIADTSLGQIVKLHIATPRKMEMEHAIRFPKPTIQPGDKLMVFRGENLRDPYETFPVLVFKLEDLPSGGMADLIKGKRIYYESEGESNWVQFNKNGTAIRKNSFHRLLFSVDGLTVRIYKNPRDTITFTFKNQSLKVGDEMTKDENDSPQRTTQISITKVESAGMPVGPPSEHR